MPLYVSKRREAILGVQEGAALLRLGRHQLRQVRLDVHWLPVATRAVAADGHAAEVAVVGGLMRCVRRMAPGLLGV